MNKLKKQFKALGGGAISAAGITTILTYINVTFELGIAGQTVAAAAVLVAVLMWGVIWLIPNIDPNIVDLKDIDLKATLMSAAGAYNIDEDTLSSIATLAESILKKERTGDDHASS